MQVRDQSTINRAAIFFTVVAFINLMIATPGVLLHFRSIYHLCFSIGLVAVLLNKRSMNILRSAYFFPIAACLFVYCLMYAFNYAIFPSCLTFVRGSMFFIFGFVIASNPRCFRWLLLLYCLFLLYIVLLMQGGIDSMLEVSQTRVDFWIKAERNLGMSDKQTFFKEIITNFVWHISYATLLVAAFLDQSSKLWPRIVVAAVMLAALLFCTVTLYTTPILVFLAGLLLLGIFYMRFMRKAPGRIFRTAIMTVLAVGIAGYIVSRVLGSFSSTEGIARSIRFATMVTLSSGDDSTQDVLDETTSGRSSLLAAPIYCFAMNPLIGIGDTHLGSADFSGHSAALDLFARYGLLGGMPVVILFICCLRITLAVARLDVTQPWTMASCMAFLTIYSISTFWNPIFLTAITEILFFLVFGYSSGRHAILANYRKVDIGRAALDATRRHTGGVS